MSSRKTVRVLVDNIARYISTFNFRYEKLVRSSNHSTQKLYDYLI